jgi:hypothetical protein
VKKLIKLLVVAGLGVATLMLAPGAKAAGPTALECAVNGSVTTDFHHYNFVQAGLSCAGVYDGTSGTSVYNVAAEGDTQSNLGGPETCDEGTNLGPGTLTATKVSGTGPLVLDGTVTFKRVGSGVIAQGALTDENGKSVDFESVMAFVPNPPTQLSGCAGGVPAVMNALLTGVATVNDPTPL